jgi:hypothetical protein
MPNSTISLAEGVLAASLFGNLVQLLNAQGLKAANAQQAAEVEALLRTVHALRSEVQELLHREADARRKLDSCKDLLRGVEGFLRRATEIRQGPIPLWLGDQGRLPLLGRISETLLT